MKKIYDTFMFFNEFDLLEVRLEYLYDLVDKFVITEADITQSGEKKPLYFQENRERYSKWEDKIIYNKVTNVPRDFTLRDRDDNTNKILNYMSDYKFYPHDVWRYDNETYQKECILLALTECDDNDLILFSDLDEIPRKDVIKKLTSVDFPSDTHITLQQTMCQYYVNVKKDEIWHGTTVFPYSLVKDFSCGLNTTRCADGIERGVKMADSGWHLTFLGGIEKIKEKIRAYGHQEFNNDFILNNVEDNVKNNRDIFYRVGHTFQDIEMDYFPEELSKLLLKFPHFIKDN
tara:strand:+ start:11702 stop:12568 length:867 start_codon:yes stop_codon:yes gene_type:complete